MSNYLAGKRVVVTGIIAGHSRGTAEAALHDAGAVVQAKVGPTTDLLICGAKVGASKTSKAEALGVQIVSWEGAFSPSPIQAVGLSVQEAAEAQEYVEEHGEPVDHGGPVRTVAPMLAKADELPTGDGWQYEVKWDGYRGIATVRGDGRCVIQSRSAKTSYTEQFPEIVRELETLPPCVIDGELVVLDDTGLSSMENMGKGEATFVVFDVLEVLGDDVRKKPLSTRREFLEVLLADVPSGGHICVSPAFDDGEALLAWGAAEKIEGIVAKRLSSTYKEGSRGGDWLKIKLRCEQEFAVCGWIPGEGARDGSAGSLLLAVYDDGVPTYVGRVGTGGDYDQWQSFTERAEGHPVLTVPKPVARQTQWIEPFVVQVRFQRWTEDGMLWHPSLIGVRDDKEPTECRREEVSFA